MTDVQEARQKTLKLAASKEDMREATRRFASVFNLQPSLIHISTLNAMCYEGLYYPKLLACM